MAALPSGTVAFLFTDIEGSTTRWQQFGQAMGDAVARHDDLLRHAIAVRGGSVFKTVGDAFCAAFPTVPTAVAAALAAQRALAIEPWGEPGPLRVRMALHVGAAEEREADYFGPAVNRVARLLSAGHGGQVLLSLPAAELVRDSLPAEAQLRDLGAHRLKDLARPEHIFQLLVPDLPTEFPPLVTLDHRPHNLPVQLTPFIGREREVATVRQRLERADVRLLTLTGPGGTGKTRLSLQVGAELIEAVADGVWFVALEQATTPAQVVAAIAQTLGVREVAGQALEVTLSEHLRGKQLLLLLDNFEQVTSAAPLLVRLVQTAPTLKVLVSSRARLGVHGEQEYAVPPLGLPNRTKRPPVEQLAEYEAIRLFVARAQAVKPDFGLSEANARAVTEICHELDGLPLAIELAAARVRVLPPQALLGRLHERLTVLVGGGQNRAARQQTLRGAIAWSHDLLTPAEQTLFARLSVFAGGCTLEAAETVGNPDGELDVLEGIGSLVDKSLLRQTEEAGEPRFVMLATIREFGLEQLAARGEDDPTRVAHADYYLAMAEQAEPELTGVGQAAWLARLEAEHDNLRAALGWFTDSGETDGALRLAGALRRFWLIRGYLSEGRTWLARSLARGPQASVAVYAKALWTAGTLAWAQSDHAEASQRLEAALALYRRLGDEHAGAHMLIQLGLVATEQGEHELAALQYEEALAHLRELGDAHGAGIVLNNLGMLAFLDGAFDRAVRFYEEGLALSRGQGDQVLIAVALHNLAEAREYQGDLDRALALYHEALRLHREHGDKPRAAFALAGLGRLAQAQGDLPAAHDLLSEALALAQEVGDQAAVAAGIEGLAAVLGAGGEAARAARLFGAADALREAIGAPLAPAYRPAYDRQVQAARGQLPERDWVAAWDIGRTLAPEAAAAEAAQRHREEQRRRVPARVTERPPSGRCNRRRPSR